MSLSLMLPTPTRIVLVDTSVEGIGDRSLRWVQRIGAPVHHLRLPGSRHQPALVELWRSALGARPAFHVEEDFLFLRRVPLDRMIHLLESEGLAQVLLRRQRWYVREFQFGTMEESINARHESNDSPNGLKVQSFFSLNPSLYTPSILVDLLEGGLDLGEAPEYDLGQALGETPFSCLMLRQRGVPAVLHTGVVSTVMLRSAPNTKASRLIIYLRYHCTRKLWHTRRLAAMAASMNRTARSNP